MNKIKGTIILLTLCITMVMTGCGSKEITLNEYVEITVSDEYNGQAEASVDINYEKLFSSINEGEEMSTLMEYAELENLVYATIDKKNNLSNGDKLNVTFHIDEEAAKENKLKFISENFTYTVEGLKEMQEVDIFENIKIEYKGISPYVSVSINCDATEEYISDWDFMIMPNSNLSIGSTYKITFTGDEETFVHNGVIPMSLEKEITITEKDVDSYISSLELLSDSDYEIMDRLIMDNIATRMNDDRTNPFYYSPYEEHVTLPMFEIAGSGKSDYISNTTPKLEATYLLTANNLYSAQNVLYRVYSTEITDSVLGSYTVYFAGSVESIIRYKDATIYFDPYHIEKNIGSVKCFDSLDSFKNKCIDSQKSDYDIIMDFAR